jgi:hypothetical protein
MNETRVCLFVRHPGRQANLNPGRGYTFYTRVLPCALISMHRRIYKNILYKAIYCLKIYIYGQKSYILVYSSI